MDLRGFTQERKGCIYELGVLRDSIMIESVVFLIDETTDYPFLKNTFETQWKTIAKDSPNAPDQRRSKNKQQQITIFKMGTSKGKSATELMQLLVEACVSTESYHQSHGKTYLQDLIEDFQLLEADAEDQLKAVSVARLPGKRVLEAGWSSDHDLGTTSYLSSWGLITDAQFNAICDVNDAVQEIRMLEGKGLSAKALKEDPLWEELRVAARKGLKALGKRRRVPNTRA